jgi:hypothetical protein
VCRQRHLRCDLSHVIGMEVSDERVVHSPRSRGGKYMVDIVCDPCGWTPGRVRTGIRSRRGRCASVNKQCCPVRHYYERGVALPRADLVNVQRAG